MIVATIFVFFCQVKDDTDLYIIDEIGKMELYSSSFFPAVTKILESDVPVLASVPLSKFGRDVPGGIPVSYCLPFLGHSHSNLFFQSLLVLSSVSLVCALSTAVCATHLLLLCVLLTITHI